MKTKYYFLFLLSATLCGCPTQMPESLTEDTVERENPCLTNNGRCGDETVFRCEDTGSATPKCHYDFISDWEFLTHNVSTLTHGESWPSTLVVHGDTAFPIALFNESQRAFIAAARVGEGKLMHWGHESYFYSLSETTDDSPQLLLNAISWMSEKETPIIGIGTGMNALANYLADEGYPVVDIDLENIDSVDIYICESYEDLSDANDQALQGFVRNGKGLITAGLAWWWAYENQNVSERFPGNQIIWNSGITIAGDWGETGTHSVGPLPPTPLDHATQAFDALLNHQEENDLNNEALTHAIATVAHAVTHLSLSFETFYQTAESFMGTVNFEAITESTPLIPADEPLRFLSTKIESKFAQEQTLPMLNEHASAHIFPGALPENSETTTLTRTINASYMGRSLDYLYSNPAEPRWESTGVYAAAGKSVFVTLPQSALGQGIDLLIGSHTDLLWAKENIERFPQITRSFEIKETTTEIKSAFGGLVYVRIPEGTDLGTISIEFDNGYLAPTFYDGVTTVEQWRQTIRDYPGVWAELVSDKFVLTFPGHLAQTLDNPDEVMAFWNEALNTAADLEGTSHERVRAERFVLDEQISVGWMHSGYPLMAFIEANEEFLDLGYIFENSIWGPFHELGHNHQSDPWLLPGTTETTCNLWSTYMTENILQMSLDDNETLAPLAREDRITAYLAGGADFYADWNVWVALDTYLQLKERFGWDFYKTIFPLYRELSEAETPTTDQARIDLWVIKSSEVAQHDLSEFYLAWGFPITQNALDAVAHFPDWDDHPMLDY